MPVMAPSSPSPPVLRHVAMLPFMAKGHTMPLLHLARLLLRRGLAATVTFLTTTRDAPFIRARVEGATAVVELPFPSAGGGGPQSTVDELASGSDLLAVVAAAGAALRPAFADALARLEPRPDLLVHDGFLPWARTAADALGVPRLVCNGTGAFASYVCTAVLAQKPHARVSSPTAPFVLDGVPGVRFTTADLHPPFDAPEPAGPLWDFVSESAEASRSSRGTIVNSFRELEQLHIDNWNREMPVKMWAIGPLCLASEPVGTMGHSDTLGVFDWLDSRLAMNRPVLYVAFGSQAELNRAQLEELATGLDLSGLDFLWVVRSNWFDQETPFENRFGERGKVVQGFIDQLGVLRHSSIKGFLSHCGWNSVLESISMGVPILAVPMAAEQKLNAKYVVDVLGVGLRVWPVSAVDDGDGEGLVLSGDVVQALARELVFGEEGKRAAARVSVLAESARNAMDEGGSSYETLELMVREVSEIGKG